MTTENENKNLAQCISSTNVKIKYNIDSRQLKHVEKICVRGRYPTKTRKEEIITV